MVLALLVVALGSCGSPQPVRKPVDGCSPARPLPAGDTHRTIQSGGEQRRYVLHVPPGHDGSRRTPLTLLFHGLGGDPMAVARTTGMIDRADDRDAIVVSPLGRGRVSQWNFRAPITDPGSDLAFVRDLVAQLRKDACIDPSRMYAAGFSNGSTLALALACDGTTPFAAYGAVSGPYYEDSCRGAPPASIIYFHGLRDRVVPYGGAAKTSIGPLPPVNQIMAEWARHDRCPPASATTTVSEHVRHFTWRPCRDGSSIDVYVVEHGGHRWPGGGEGSPGHVSGIMTQEIDASALIWRFFDRHRAGGQ